MCNFRTDDVVSSLLLCSKHFHENDYSNPNCLEYGGLLRLKPNAIPSVNVPGKSMLHSPSMSREAQPATSKLLDIRIPVKCNECNGNVQSGIRISCSYFYI